MSKEIYISSTPHETRLAIVEKEELSEIYYERENEYTLAGSIYNGRVTRVLPGMQSAFVDVGLERDAFLYITDFMEEQGESADFESGEGRRASSDRSDRSDRGDRGGERSASGGERNASGGERSAERGGERSGGERGGRRGDRDRSGRVREQEPREAVSDEDRVVPAALEPQAMPGEPEGSAEGGDETGEGSRRWRGRRGRRRGGRGGETGAPVQGGEAATAAEEEAPDAIDEPESGPLERMYGQEEAAPQATGREDRGRGGRGERDDRGRGRDRDRGGDRGRGGDRDRGPRSDRSEERGGGSGPELQAGAEPMILPGESLSRYRKGDDAQESATVSSKPKPSYLTTHPSTEIDLSLAKWDGGATLPGETLSRRRGQTEAPQAGARTEPTQYATGEQDSGSDTERQADGGARGAGRRRDRDKRRGRSGGAEERRPFAQTGASADTTGEEEPTPTSFRSGVVARESLDPMDAVQPGVSSEHEPESTPLVGGESLLAAAGTSDDVPEFEIEAFEAQREAEATVADDVIYEPETDVVRSAGPDAGVIAAVEAMHAGVELEPVHAGEEFHEETHEYEPGDEASASYRVDPAGPSEFRQSGVADDEDVNEGDPEVQADYAGMEHQYTTLGDSGELLSELPGEVFTPGAEEDPANPIEHETAVLTQRASELLDDAQTAQPAEGGAPKDEASDEPQQGFAPGLGDLQEEFLDEDDTEVLDVAASYGEDTEEETFEAGAEISAQLGSLVRDRTLDELTQGDTVVIGDDDFDLDDEEMEEDELEGDEELAASDIADIEEDEVLEGEEAQFDAEGGKPAAASMGEFPEFAEERAPREPRRTGTEDRGADGRRDGRRGEGRGGDRGGRDRGSRDRRGMAGSRSGGRGGSRHSMQNTDLPAISDLLKPGQEVLVQIAKEPIAKKGARITSHIALPGRFLVFMPTVNHVGVSRKIESDGERRRLKEILLSEKGEASGGFIVRTAASGASEDELRSDLRFLLNLWAEIKQRSESSKSPALIYHDLNLVERILRDQVSENFSAIWCDTESEYERVLRFLQRFQPSLMRRVKLYTKDTPLFEQFGITEEINKALRSKVWLKSGGSIVINQTEALVAIDINTGKYVGKTARLEDTIVKTNLDAIPEIVRQVRLRDLGGIIVIDFIDMDDRKNRQKVLIALEEELKKDRAPSKVLQFNDFGLVAITRKRVKQSLERTLSTTCGICAGTGMVKSPVTVCNEIYTELRKMHKQLDKGDVMLRVNPEVVKQLKANNAKWLLEMEEIAGKTILVKSDPSLHPEQFDIH